MIRFTTYLILSIAAFCGLAAGVAVVGFLLTGVGR